MSEARGPRGCPLATVQRRAMVNGSVRLLGEVGGGPTWALGASRVDVCVPWLRCALRGPHMAGAVWYCTGSRSTREFRPVLEGNPIL